MSKLEKAKERLRACPKDYTYSEVRTLLMKLGFEEHTKGKTSGSRMMFFRKSDSMIIMLHKPHPGDIMSLGAIKDIADRLTETGDI